MTNKSTKHLTKDKQVPEWRSNLDAVVAAFTIGWGLWSLWQNRGMTEHFLKFCSALLLSIPQWINASVIIFFWGVVTMGLRQRRDITSPDINAKNRNLRQFAERTAMNTPIQGSAADIIKVAMINMAQALKDQHLQATMLLQVHDELLFEAPREEIPILEKLVPSIMDSAVKLAVPLKVDSSFGDTWYDVK